MPWYRAGTVAITAGQTTVTGTSTNFALNARVGDAFQGPDGRWYEVANIASATVLSILPAYQGATVATGSYGLAPMQGYVKDLADRVRQMVDGWGTALASLGTASTGTLTTSTTDSTVGRVMRIGDLGFTGTAVSLPITDLNTVTSPGRYAFGNGVTNGPATGVAYYVDVLRHGSLVTQIAYGMTAGFVGKMYTRLYSTSWSGWSEKPSAGDYGIGGTAVLLTGAQLNALNHTVTGNYAVIGAEAAVVGIVPSYGGTVFHQGRPGETATQTYRSTGTADNQVQERSWSSVGGWTPWRRLYHQGNIVGTVSQTGGVPTGAIIETGTNANGTYTKFADGSMICRGIADLGNVAVTTLAATGLYTSAIQIGRTFPAQFSGQPQCLLDIATGNATCYSTKAGLPTASATQGFYVQSPQSQTVNVAVSYIAYGRWF